MPCQESIADAKASFVSAVTEGIDVLMTRCGYSRERAASALLRELNRGESRPTDEEIFQLVRSHGLGIEEATKTLIVSKALKRAISASGGPAKAIELLASKIALSNLLYESDEDFGSEEDLIRSEQQITRVPSAEKFTARTAKSQQARKPRGQSKTPRPKPKPTTKASTAGRKRSFDEIVPVEMKNSSGFQSRPRSDSATEEVDAKLAKKSNEESPSNELLRTTPNARAKRVHRGEENDPLGQPSTMKRSRMTEG